MAFPRGNKPGKKIDQYWNAVQTIKHGIHEWFSTIQGKLLMSVARLVISLKEVDIILELKKDVTFQVLSDRKYLLIQPSCIIM